MSGGYLDWSGLKATAARFREYLMTQTVMRFATASARDTALSSVLEEGLPSLLLDGNSATFYTGSTWSTVGPLWGAWTSYSPTLTNITIGNGATTAAYARIGRDVVYKGRITFGSTSAMGSSPRVTLPFAPANDIDIESESGVGFFDSSVGGITGRFGGQLYLVTGSTVELVSRASGGNAAVQVTATAPFTWATSDTVWWKIWYEAAGDA